MSALVRTACLTNFRETARAAGLSSQHLLAKAGLDASVLREPDLKIPAELVRQLLEVAAVEAGDESFALRMTESRQLSTLGPVGLLMRDQPTLLEALDVLLRYHRTLNGALCMSVESTGAVVVIRAEVLGTAARPVRQCVELALGTLMRVLRHFLGADWQPRSVRFAHAAPRDLATHLRVFGRHLEFGQEFTAIVCHAADLDVGNPAADRAMTRYAQQLLDASIGAHAPSMLEEVRHAIAMLLPSGRCNIGQVSEHLGVACRTVQRRLAQHGAAFSALVDEARAALAARHLSDTSRPLGEVAGLLGFSEQSSFSRWHRDTFGCSPKERRAAGRRASPAGA